MAHRIRHPARNKMGIEATRRVQNSSFLIESVLAKWDGAGLS